MRFRNLCFYRSLIIKPSICAAINKKLRIVCLMHAGIFVDTEMLLNMNVNCIYLVFFFFLDIPVIYGDKSDLSPYIISSQFNLFRHACKKCASLANTGVYVLHVSAPYSGYLSKTNTSTYSSDCYARFYDLMIFPTLTSNHKSGGRGQSL